MKKTTTKKITLSTQTLRPLDAPVLPHVKGADGSSITSGPIRCFGRTTRTI